MASGRDLDKESILAVVCQTGAYCGGRFPSGP